MKLFTQHPNSVGESYLQHLKHTFYLGYTLIKISLIIFVHGLLPFLFTTTSSDMILKLSIELQQKNKRSINNIQ
ncbi:DUF6356 family protein [Candidatus Tisiphia endosymbiont of Dioctria rufipes]|uniref:DUF6356 family protein n=1 Tax=unclassified Candidatus Tisiphia TaxID=2996318 RepID=UPI0039772DC5